MILDFIMSEENYSNGFKLDHILSFLEGMQYQCKEHGANNIKMEVVSYHKTEILVIYIDKFTKKELAKLLKEELLD